MRDVSRLLTLVNGAALHKALKAQGERVSYRTVARWVGPAPELRPPPEMYAAILKAAGVQTEEAPRPVWAEGLEDAIAEAVVMRLGTPDALVDQLESRLAELGLLPDEAPPEESSTPPGGGGTGRLPIRSRRAKE